LREGSNQDPEKRSTCAVKNLAITASLRCRTCCPSWWKSWTITHSSGTWRIRSPGFCLSCPFWVSKQFLRQLSDLRDQYLQSPCRWVSFSINREISKSKIISNWVPFFEITSLFRNNSLSRSRSVVSKNGTWLELGSISN
jgi:hypothetical protein